MTDYDSQLSPLQVDAANWLRERNSRLLADPPGFGKTRTLLAAVGEGANLLVVSPAGIRDAQVWPDEAKRTGWGGALLNISYHQLAQWKNRAPQEAMKLGIDAVVFDESHHLKNRNVSWAHPAQRLGDTIDVVYEGTGTPTPNVASELWGQLRVIRGDWKDRPEGIWPFWRWASGNQEPYQGWFHVTTEYAKNGEILTQYAINGHLESCYKDHCFNAERDTTYRGYGERLLPVTDRECPHWKRFRDTELQDWLLARSEDLLDLPPMSGDKTPFWTPMLPAQKRAYKELSKNYLTEITGADGKPRFVEASSDSKKFIQLWQLSTGAGAVDPAADERDSGKLKMMAELLDERRTQTLLACYFRNTGQILQNVCRRLGKKYVTFGANDSAAQRRNAIVAFQNGDVDVMVGSIAVVGEGVTLTAADGVWLTERMWTPDKNTQVIRRVRRRGQDKPVGVRQFITPETIDQGQWEMLGNKTARISQVDPVKLLRGELAMLDD